MTDMNKFKALPIESLALAPWNYKTDDAEKQAKLVGNIKRNGQVENILVREIAPGVFEVVNGNHRLKAFQEVGMKEVMVYDLGKISDAAAMRIAIETNETKFGVDNLKLATRLTDIMAEFPAEELLTTLPYNAKDLEELVKLTSFDWKALEKQPEEATDVPEMKSSSDGVVKVSMTFTKADHDEFMQKLDVLAPTVDKENITDAVLAIVRSAFDNRPQTA